jgi:K+/H+ antiporter YhaU regulatory subunit KhtT
MIRAALSVDESSASPFRFVKHPKLGDRIGVSRFGTRTMATIVGMRMDEGPDGLGTLLVFARSA